MRARMLSVAVPLLLVLGVPATRAAITLPAYMNPYGFGVALNTSWGGAMVPAALPSFPPLDGRFEKGQNVWATTCGSGQQVVTFTRHLELPGPLSSGRLSWSAFTTGTGWKGITAMELSANSKLLGAWKAPAPMNSIDFTGPALAAFRDGTNDVQLRVVRSALPKKVKRCNAIGAPYAVGMRAAIEGAWQTDLRPGIPAEPSHYQRAFTGIIQQFVQNESDVRAYNVRAVVFNGSSGTKVTVGQSGDAAGTNISGLCSRAPGSNTETVCTYDSIAPHERKNILIRYEYTPAAGLPFDHDGIRVDLRVLTDSPDSNSSNNVSEQSIFFCAPTSKFTGCDKAT